MLNWKFSSDCRISGSWRQPWINSSSVSSPSLLVSSLANTRSTYIMSPYILLIMIRPHVSIYLPHEGGDVHLGAGEGRHQHVHTWAVVSSHDKLELFWGFLFDESTHVLAGCKHYKLSLQFGQSLQHTLCRVAKSPDFPIFPNLYA